MYRYLNELSKLQSKVQAFSIGHSHERRPILAAKIHGNTNDPGFIWIDACTHSREWITVAVALFIIEKAILTNLKANIIIVPVLNPDGYEYTWTHDRLWRKNRRLFVSPYNIELAGDQCNGVDLNRNYDINFGGKGSSDSTCSNLYQGAAPFSEPETQSLAYFIWSTKGDLRFFLSLHSFNQLWASPYAFTKTASPDVADHMDVLRAIQDAVYRTNGIKYQIGPLSTSLYVGSGFAMDWVYHTVRVKHSYLAELRDKGYYGFLLPADQIIPTASETWEGLKAALKKTHII